MTDNLENNEIKEVTADTVSQTGSEEHHHHHHSHHHHSHHHHSHRRKKSSSKKKQKLKAFFKNNRSVLINIAACTVSVVCLALLAFHKDTAATLDKSGENSVSVTDNVVKIESSVYLDEITLVTPAILAYMDEENTKSAHGVYGEYNGYKSELSKGLPLKYTYRLSGLPSGVEVDRAQLLVSEHEDFLSAVSYPLDPEGTDVQVYNLKPATHYFYRLDLTLSTGNTVSNSGDFKTAASPRLLFVDGAVNVRDFGGYTTESGKTVPYGLIYRGSEIDGAVVPDYKISERGAHELLYYLGVRYEMDLRADFTEGTFDALGAGVVHEYFGMCQYADTFKSENAETVRRVFSALAKEENYPMYMHCTYGRDRTGTVCYLLGALLGMSERDLYREYELSAFVDSYVSSENFAVFLAYIDLLEGETLSEKAEKFLLSVGVSAEEIESIKTIFLG